MPLVQPLSHAGSLGLPEKLARCELSPHNDGEHALYDSLPTRAIEAATAGLLPLLRTVQAVGREVGRAGLPCYSCARRAVTVPPRACSHQPAMLFR